MLNPDYRDMLSALIEAEADFVVVGAFALAAYGNPRATGDIDLLVRPSQENATRVIAGLASFGAPTKDLSIEDLITPGTVFQIGIVPRRIDILTSIDGIESFESVWSERSFVELDGLKIPLIGREHLIRNKKALGRPQDLADVAWLEAHPPE